MLRLANLDFRDLFSGKRKNNEESRGTLLLFSRSTPRTRGVSGKDIPRLPDVL